MKVPPLFNAKDDKNPKSSGQADNKRVLSLWRDYVTHAVEAGQSVNGPYENAYFEKQHVSIDD